MRVSGESRSLFEDGRVRLLDRCRGLLPLAATILAVFAIFGSEAAALRRLGEMSLAWPDFTALMKFLTSYGNIPFYAVYAAVLLSGLRTGRRRDVCFVLGYVIFLVVLLMAVDVVKIWVGRPRPGRLGECVAFSLSSAYHSFPSAHMSETVFTVLPLSWRCRSAGVSLACGVWVAVMGFTRLFLGRHFPTDLLGGAALGMLGALALWRLSAAGGLAVRGSAERGGACVSQR